MALEFILEADSALRRSELINALSHCGASDFLEVEYGFNGEFLDSGMNFYAYERSKPYWDRVGFRDCVVAENLPCPIGWSVGIKVIFRFSNLNYEMCNRDMTCLVKYLAGNSSARFVVSFQYENIYVIRDDKDLKFLIDF
ncbi:hypothetical protein ACQ4WY_25445 [Janthinobacterium sp. LB2P49]|uniref:hypothetical protein n=1 Tax=Janthinobacterium sp. LB2P49 TaxID=3424198 RepID=UPI003F1F9A3D